MCQALNVSRSCYYAYVDRPPSKRSIENEKLLQAIKKIHKGSRRIYGSPQITKNLPAALTQAIGRTNAKEGLLVHSDRGVQYTSKDYQKLLEQNGFIYSMSRKGNCYDNAPIESFWGKLKMERLNDYKFKTRSEANKVIFEYIELFYNRYRTHSSNGYIPPFMLEEMILTGFKGSSNSFRSYLNRWPEVKCRLNLGRKTNFPSLSIAIHFDLHSFLYRMNPFLNLV